MHFPRLLAILGGTTSLADCLVAGSYLVNGRKLTKGPAITEYEQAFARKINVRFAVSFGSGRVALYGLLRALGIGPDDEVLLQVPTHIVVANAIRYVGAKPVYVDCRTDTYNIDLDHAETKITPASKALLLQHTFGNPVDLKRAQALAEKHNLAVIEDCVHALGATYDGRPLGSFGRAAIFSTEETKTITTTMGGMAVTNDPELATRLRQFQGECRWPDSGLTRRFLLRLIIYHIFTQPYLYPYTQFLFALLRRNRQLALAPETATDEEERGLKPPRFEKRLSNSQAVLALRQLRRLNKNLSHRRNITRAYQWALAEHNLGIPIQAEEAEPAFVRLPIWVTDPEETRRAASGVAQLGEWFTSVLLESESPIFGGYEFGSCPRAEDATRHLINLPTHPRVNLRDVKSIVEIIVEQEFK